MHASLWLRTHTCDLAGSLVRVPSGAPGRPAADQVQRLAEGLGRLRRGQRSRGDEPEEDVCLPGARVGEVGDGVIGRGRLDQAPSLQKP
jgi:hypothetical protein